MPSRRDEALPVPMCVAIAFALAVTFTLATPASAQWNGFAGNAQHTAVAAGGSQALNRIVWSTPVDLQPQVVPPIHYGSPLITAANTLIVPVKTGATGGFRVDARNGATGSLLWSMPTDYVLPPHSTVPVFGPAMTSQPRLYFPGIGGTVYFRDKLDTVCPGPVNCQGQLAFFGMKNYRKHRKAYNARVQINTPLTTDQAGNVYFGFVVSNAPNSHPLKDSRGKRLTSGIARIGSSGAGTWTPAPTAAADGTMSEVVQNCAPALSADLQTLYVAVSDGVVGYLVALNSSTFAPIARVRLEDPKAGADAILSDDASSTPTVGPDGDVYFGVIESSCCKENHGRGWLLHFDAMLSQSKTPGAFGFDTTVSIVPSTMIASYGGPSSYLLVTKYNNYADPGFNGDGMNKVAVLDPNATETDPVSGLAVMNEVRTVLGPTPDGALPGVKEWCINSAAVDPSTDSILVNSEDGKLYRWLLSTNTLSESVGLTAGVTEAYTPTVIGTDGTAYAINGGILFAVGQ
jgi:hypothetical protein